MLSLQEMTQVEAGQEAQDGGFNGKTMGTCGLMGFYGILWGIYPLVAKILADSQVLGLMNGM